MLRYDGVYIYESEEGWIQCLRFYPASANAHESELSPTAVIGMTTFPDRLERDLQWFGIANANRFAVECTSAFVSFNENTMGFELTRDSGYSWSYGQSRRFEGTIREDSLDLETHRWNESFETCPHILCYFEFRPLPPEFEQDNAATRDPKTVICVR